MDGLLTEIVGEWHARLTDSVRTLSWSPGGRLLAIGADGRALVDDADRLTAPLGPDPLDAVWLDEHRVAVVDAVLGLVLAGRSGMARIAATSQRVRLLTMQGSRRLR